MSRKALLNQSGDRVLCWHCKGEIARVVETAFVDRMIRTHAEHSVLGRAGNSETMASGISQNASRSDFRQGREPRQRRNLDGSHHGDEARLVGRAPLNLPVEARCTCTWRNACDPTDLRVRRRTVDLHPMNRLMDDGSLKLVDPDPWELCPYEK